MAPETTRVRPQANGTRARSTLVAGSSQRPRWNWSCWRVRERHPVGRLKQHRFERRAWIVPHAAIKVRPWRIPSGLIIGLTIWRVPMRHDDVHPGLLRPAIRRFRYLHGLRTVDKDRPVFRRGLDRLPFAHFFPPLNRGGISVKPSHPPSMTSVFRNRTASNRGSITDSSSNAASISAATAPTRATDNRPPLWPSRRYSGC